MTDTMTRYPIDMAVRFWDRQSGEERIEEVSGEAEAAKLTANLLADDVRSQVVIREHFEPPPWTVNRATQERLDRKYVESTVELLAEEFGGAETSDEQEIALRGACDKLRLIATGLAHPGDVRTRTEDGKTVTRLIKTGHRVDEECQLATWLERAANILTECAEIRAGGEKADSNDETLDAELEHHLNVLANLADHGVGEYGCTRCSVISAPAKAAEVAA